MVVDERAINQSCGVDILSSVTVAVSSLVMCRCGVSSDNPATGECIGVACCQRVHRRLNAADIW